MPSLLEQLNADLKDAMRAGDGVRRDEIRGLLAMLKAEQQTKLTRSLTKQGLILHGDNVELTSDQQAQIDQVRRQHVARRRRGTGRPAPARQAAPPVDRRVQEGKRPDLVPVEEAQLAVDESYLPQQLDAAAVEDAMQAAIRESGAQGPRDQGKVMGLLSARLRGRADMKAVAARVQALLRAHGWSLTACLDASRTKSPSSSAAVRRPARRLATAAPPRCCWHAKVRRWWSPTGALASAEDTVEHDRRPRATRPSPAKPT